MVICFDATAEAKRALDALLATRQFRDVSEVISMALMNYEVLQRSVGSGDLAGASANPLPQPGTAAATAAAPPATPGSSFARGSKKVPDIFTASHSSSEGFRTAPLDEPTGPVAKNLPPKDWLFGQLNRFLPAKATCRALLNISHYTPAGMGVNDAASKISFAACELGDYLRDLDAKFSSKREESFAAAFPSTAEHGAESRVRFGGQFVGNIKQAHLSGLPAALKLVAHDASKDPKLLLTPAGIAFATLPNPVLDSAASQNQKRLGDDEIQFLLRHIAKFVPQELSAYLALLDGIASGASAPEKLDVFLCSRFGLTIVEKAKSPNQITQTFLTTQRTGAISRMADLDLVGRQKKGIRVSYFVTNAGEAFRSSNQRK